MVDITKLDTELLLIAGEELGVHEIGNTNTGKRVNEYLASVGFEPGAPWCAAFVYWCILQTCKKMGIDEIPFIRTASTGTILEWAQSHNIVYETPLVGDVFLVGKLSLSGTFVPTHTGFVTKLGGQSFNTIEGNTNDNGSAEGIGVFARSRAFNNRKYRFIRFTQVMTALNATYDLIVNGKHITNMPIRGDMSLCPVRLWANTLNVPVGWDNDTQTVTVNNEGLAAQVTMINGSAYLPFRFLALQAGLQWVTDTKNRRVSVTVPAVYKYPIP